jgi:hypothetical protein
VPKKLTIKGTHPNIGRQSFSARANHPSFAKAAAGRPDPLKHSFSQFAITV